jgi:hypothetical protein
MRVLATLKDGGVFLTGFATIFMAGCEENRLRGGRLC